MEQNIESQQERREARRKRRVRNQIIAYITVIAMTVVVAVGIVFTVKYLTDAAHANEQEKQEQLEQMIGTEETLPQPETVTASAQPTETVTELTPQQKLDAIINARIEVMPLEDKVAGLFIVTPESITGVNAAVKAGDGTKDALTKYAVGGIIYQSKNIKNEAQFKEMIDKTKLYASYPLFIAVEDEGGKISPMAQAGLVNKVPDAAAVAQGGNAEAAYEAGSAIGAYLADYGFNLDLAPVADITSVDKSVMTGRAYGSDASAAAPFVNAMMQGLKDRQINTCLKHFPGMGSTDQDTDKGLATSNRSAEDFRANEFTVFQAGIDAGADMIMVSHMAAPALAGDNTPCSMSQAVVTGILRGELGFDGIIITDAMNISAISDYYGADQAAILALRAGCDMILMPENFEKAYNGVLEAVKNGEISEERVNDALRRIYRIKDAKKLEE